MSLSTSIGMKIILRFQGMFIAALFLALSMGTAQAQDEHDDHGQDAVHATESHTADASAHEEGQEHADHGEHHATDDLTPTEEMMHILEHKVENTPYIKEYPFPKIYLPKNWVVNVAGISIDMSPNRHLVYMWLGVLLTILLTWLAARQNRSGVVPRGYGNMIESVVVFIRDEVAMPFLGKDSARFMPLLLTFFFFIAVMNLVGLLPYGAASTGNINITGGLALITFIMMIVAGMKANGAVGFWTGLVPHGIPWPIGILMFVIEILGLLIKPFALAIRLFANMLSGALVIGAFYALIFGMDTLLVAPMSIGFLLFMSLLKIFISFLQAYIFTMLSSFFIGMSVHQDH